ncbi:conjugal transfer protein TraD [Xanthomonas citri pv. citri]|nr:conjugal transfer protein TraD [Xanthomonas citri pv. citri]
MTLARVRDQVRKDDTRRKIELGGLVIKAGLAELDRAVIFGALLDAATRLQGEHGEALRLQFLEAGKHEMTPERG